ncbi:zinc finger protein 98-like [Tigriopus californicus]|uniref:zinc finger protein 98-like n=1 Tax=Tigriopus californicus TaxID=6832 RepID=UPI0027DA0208|nr:zinc finger protein 98-like [Tigriopus californicus]
MDSHAPQWRSLLFNFHNLDVTPPAKLTDLTFHTLNDHSTLSSFSLIWAIWSPMLKAALLDTPPEADPYIILEGHDQGHIRSFLDFVLSPDFCQDKWEAAQSLISTLGIHLFPITAETPGPPKSKFKCKVCSKDYVNELSFLKHLKSHNKGLVADQVISDQRPHRTAKRPARLGSDFEEEFEDLDHTRSKKSGRHLCSICSKVFSSSGSLRHHMLLHEGKRDFSCDKCDKKFASSLTLRAHQKLHEEHGSQYVCEHCERSFKSYNNMTRHIRSAHFEWSDGKLFSCNVCLKDFKDPSALAAHKKIHDGVRNFKCETCSKAFLTGAQLRVHWRIHTGERPFECQECHQRFITNGNLKSHIKFRHQGLKLKKEQLCVTCGSVFVNKHDLEVHIRKHTGELPFNCDHCGKGFRSARHCEEHNRTHTSERPYKCDTCQEAFKGPGGLRQHFKSNANCCSNARPGAFSVKRKRPSCQKQITPKCEISGRSSINPDPEERSTQTTVLFIDQNEITFVSDQELPLNDSIGPSTMGNVHENPILTWNEEA